MGIWQTYAAQQRFLTAATAPTAQGLSRRRRPGHRGRMHRPVRLGRLHRPYQLGRAMTVERFPRALGADSSPLSRYGERAVNDNPRNNSRLLVLPPDLLLTLHLPDGGGPPG